MPIGQGLIGLCGTGAVMAEDVRKTYRFLTGEDTPDFCARVSTALDEGYVLYGNPVMVMEGERRIVGQAVVLDGTRPAGTQVRTGEAE